ncbi:MAG: GNAT family N-acetyltransferase, partial [Ruminococcus sp.]|nr:GNAT family N-acetyltransferase [Ruminococcus sp.]
MNYEILDMELCHIIKYAELFVSVFNSEPWNDSWTKETAVIRIENMMKTNTFIGKALFFENDMKGIIWGQKEQYYNGIHFQIQEFCVKITEQNKGYGKKLLQELKDELSEIGVTNT